MIEDIKTADIQKVLEQQEFDQSLIAADEQVVLILTQSWCSQWHYMEQWLNELIKNNEQQIKNVKIFKFIYDQSPFFSDFLDLKENVWNNHTIPYLRFYRQGKKIAESNYIPSDHFLEILNN